MGNRFLVCTGKDCDELELVDQGLKRDGFLCKRCKGKTKSRRLATRQKGWSMRKKTAKNQD